MVRSAPLVKIPSKLRGNCEVSAGRDSDGECAGAKRVIVEGESQRRSGPSTSSLFPLIISSVLPHHSFLETISFMHLSRLLPRTFALGLKLSGLAKVPLAPLPAVETSKSLSLNVASSRSRCGRPLEIDVAWETHLAQLGFDARGKLLLGAVLHQWAPLAEHRNLLSKCL